MPKDKTSFDVRRVSFFSDTGRVEGFEIIAGDRDLSVYVERRGKNIFLSGNQLPIKQHSKLLRLVKKLDKVGKNMVDL